MKFIQDDSKDLILREDVREKSLSELILFFIDTSRAFRTIDNEGNICGCGRLRSCVDIHKFCENYIACSIDDVYKETLKLCEDEKLEGLWCYEVKKFVFGFEINWNTHHKGLYLGRAGRFQRYANFEHLEGLYQEELEYIRKITQDEEYCSIPLI